MKITVNGMNITFKITNYIKNKPNWTYCTASFINDGVNYLIDKGELMLSKEVEELHNSLKKLLDNKIKAITKVNFFEPDFEFKLFPQSSFLRSDTNKRELIDIYILWRIYFWSNGLTNNYLTITLYRKQIEKLYIYLSKIIKATKLVDINSQKQYNICE